MPNYHGPDNPRYESIERQMLSMHEPLAQEIIPYVRSCVDRYDDPWRNPVPRREMMNRMYDDIMGSWSPGWYSSEVEANQFEGRYILRPLVFALLIGELLRRRRRIYR